MSDSGNNKATILVADDADANRDLLSVLLLGEGYNVISAADGEQALRAVQEGSVDLALLDVMMPGKTGFAVCQAIKEPLIKPRIRVLGV